MISKNNGCRYPGVSICRIRGVTSPVPWVAGTLGSLFIIFSFSGCQTTLPDQNRTGTKEDVRGALATVAGALGGKPLDEEGLRDLEKQIRADEGARTAVRAISESVGGKKPAVKYCPVTGRRYAPTLEICPEHGVKLKTVDPGGEE